METVRLRLSELRDLPDVERSAKLRSLVEATRRPPNGEVARLDARIREREQEHGFSSAELRCRLAQGTVRETPAVCEWLMLLDLREHIAPPSPRPR